MDHLKVGRDELVKWESQRSIAIFDESMRSGGQKAPTMSEYSRVTTASISGLMLWS